MFCAAFAGGSLRDCRLGRAGGEILGADAGILGAGSAILGAALVASGFAFFAAGSFRICQGGISNGNMRVRELSVSTKFDNPFLFLP